MDDHSPAWRGARRVLVQTAVILMAVASRTYILFAVLGIWNRLFGGWASLFFCYAGSRNYIASYAPPMAEELLRWAPTPIAVLMQDGQRGLVVGAAVTEAEFLDPANAAAFRKLRLRLALAAKLMGVSRVSLAGILPSVLRDDDVLDIPDTRPVVAAAVLHAVGEVVDQRFGGVAPPIILLGGAGHVGRPTTDLLRQSGYLCQVVDPRDGTRRLPEGLRGQDALLVDISRFGAIGQHIADMWPELVVLNETFPRPKAAHRAAMQAAGVDLYHVAGVKGSVQPPLPFGYENAVPCCAAHTPPGAGEAEVVLLATGQRAAGPVD